MSGDALYVDASATVKTFIDEPGSEAAREAIADAAGLISNQILYTEVGAAIARRAANEAELNSASKMWSESWSTHQIVDIDQRLMDHALSLAAYHGLGTLDAIHLASVLRIPAVPLRFATWDRTLWDAARAVGLRTVPDERP